MTTESLDPNPEPNPLKLAIPVSERVQIKNVFILESRYERTGDNSIKDSGFKVKQSYTAEPVDVRQEPLEILVKLDFVLETEREADDNIGLMVSIKTRFALTYSIESLEGITETNLYAFAITNGVYNAWPYWREYVQSSTTRMGLPAIVAPVFRFPVPKSKRVLKEEQPESKPPTPNSTS